MLTCRFGGTLIDLFEPLVAKLPVGLGRIDLPTGGSFGSFTSSRFLALLKLPLELPHRMQIA